MLRNHHFQIDFENYFYSSLNSEEIKYKEILLFEIYINLYIKIQFTLNKEIVFNNFYCINIKYLLEELLYLAYYIF